VFTSSAKHYLAWINFQQRATSNGFSLFTIHFSPFSMNSHPHDMKNNIKRSDLLTDIVIGMSDGLTVPFALTAGLSAAIDSNATIAIAGSAAVLAGSVAMGMGGYQAAKSEAVDQRAELKREYGEIGKGPDPEKKEIKTFFANIGLSEEMQDKAAEEISNDKKQWADFITKYDLDPGRPDPEKATRSALNIGLSYALGGLVPVIPYAFVVPPSEGLKISALITLACLFIFGFLKSKIRHLNPWLGAIRVMLIGALAAGAAFGAAKLFEL
jgi:VIT1/CCC1 family predicted Fe2+/Mn2+ transporter